MNLSKGSSTLEALKKVGIYTRKSLEDDKEHGSCEVQASMCKDLVAKHQHEGWVVHAVLADNGYTGANLNRPGIRKLIEMIGRHEIQIVVCYRRDRLFRDTGISTDLQTYFDVHNVTVVSVVEGVHDSGPHAKFVRNLLDNLAELERMTIIGRVRDSVRASAARGEWKAGIPSFGYSYTKGSKKLTINEDEAGIVRYIFDAIAAGTHRATVAAELREKNMHARSRLAHMGDESPRRHPVYIACDDINRIVRNVVYRGCVRARNPDIVDPKSPEAWLIFKGAHAALVPDELWFSANASLDRILPRHTVRRVDSANPVSFLSGMVRCGECGCAMTIACAGRNRKNVLPHESRRYMRCVESLRAAERTQCSTRSASVDAIEGAILSFIESVSSDAAGIARLEVRERMAKNAEIVAQRRKKLFEVEESLAKKKESVQNLINFIKEGKATAVQSDLVKSAEDENASLAELEIERAQIEADILAAGARMPQPAIISKAFRRFALGMAGADLRTKRSLAGRVFERISVTRVHSGLVQSGKVRTKRTFRVSLKVATNRLLAFVESSEPLAVNPRRYADLEFSLTVEIASSKLEQKIHILETNCNLVSAKFVLPVKSPVALKTPTENPVQRALRWQSLLASTSRTVTDLAASENVSPATISVHTQLLKKLSPKVISFLKDGKDREFGISFTMRELQRIAAMSPAKADEVFVSRVNGKPFQDEMELSVAGASG